jgi:Bacterial dnaA protein helix-turn-helix
MKTSPENQAARAAEIIRAVALKCGVSASKIVSRTRQARISKARFLTVHLLKLEFSQWTLTQLAEAVRLTDHTGAIHALKRVDELHQEDHAFREHLNELQEELFGIKPSGMRLSASIRDGLTATLDIARSHTTREWLAAAADSLTALANRIRSEIAI